MRSLPGGDRTVRIFTPNPEILLRRERSGLRGILRSADLALPDGTGVALVETLRAGRRVRRWPGVEIGELLVRLGGRERRDRRLRRRRRGRGRASSRAMAATAPRRADRGRRRGRLGLGGRGRPSRRERSRLTRAVAAASPAIVLVAFGAPKQERWIARHADDVPSARIMIGVGGSFDMWANDLRRSPVPPNPRAGVGVALGAGAAPLPEDVPRDDPVPAPGTAGSSGMSGDHLQVAPRPPLGLSFHADRHRFVLPPTSLRHRVLRARASRAPACRGSRRHGDLASRRRRRRARPVLRRPGLPRGGPPRRSFDRIIVHFQPGLYYRPGATAAVSKIRTSLALRALVRRGPRRRSWCTKPIGPHDGARIT